MLYSNADDSQQEIAVHGEQEDEKLSTRKRERTTANHPNLSRMRYQVLIYVCPKSDEKGLWTFHCCTLFLM